MVLNFTEGIGSTHGDVSLETRGPLVLVVHSVLLAVAILVVGSRILVKAKLRKLAVEDSLIVAATVGYPPSTRLSTALD